MQRSIMISHRRCVSPMCSALRVTEEEAEEAQYAWLDAIGQGAFSSLPQMHLARSAVLLAKTPHVVILSWCNKVLSAHHDVHTPPVISSFVCVCLFLIWSFWAGCLASGQCEAFFCLSLLFSAFGDMRWVSLVVLCSLYLKVGLFVSTIPILAYVANMLKLHQHMLFLWNFGMWPAFSSI